MKRISDILSDCGAADDGPAGEQFRLPRARSHIIRSAASGDLYRIDMAIPSSPPPATGWPFVILLDADGCFATCVEAVRRMGRRPDATGVVPCAIIGISSQDGEDVIRRRQRDFTSPREGEPGTGGAAAFLSFIMEEVQPFVARLAPLDSARGTLFGHSLAGFFVLWVLGNRPDAFRVFAAISPSIWWDRPGLTEAFRQPRSGDPHVLLVLGEWEDQLPPWQRASPGSEQVVARRSERKMLESVRTVAEQLDSMAGSGRVRLDVLADEDHASIISAAIPRMLRIASLA